MVLNKMDEKTGGGEKENEEQPFVICVDTNFLIYIIKQKIELSSIKELFSEPVVIATVPAVIKELERLAENKGKAGIAARIALDLPLFIIKGESNAYLSPYADSALVQAVKDKLCRGVATNDKKLSKAIKEAGGIVVGVRGTRQLQRY